MALIDRLLDRYHMRKRGWQVLEFMAAARYPQAMTPRAWREVRSMRRAIARAWHLSGSGSQAFREHAVPEVSVVIPAFNQWGLTRRCLASLSESSAAHRLEVIVVDDCSTDETAASLRGVAGVRVITNARNEGFNRAASLGARAAQGRYVVFLNNDTVVLPGWLDGLLAAMSDADVGAAGSKLVFPSGRLQEAGCLVWSDGSSLMLGRWRSPADAGYDFLREVDYCSAASLMVRSDVLREVGYFDERFAPAYFEDADLCFSVRARGLRVVYAPASAVAHVEGQSHAGGFAYGAANVRGPAHQQRNRGLFVEKWREELRAHLPRPQRPDVREVWGSHSGTGVRVLVCDQRWGDPTNPISEATYQRFHELARSTSRVTLLTAGAGPSRGAGRLQDAGVEVVRGNTAARGRFVRGRAGFYDIIVVRGARSRTPATATLRRHNPHAFVAFNPHELEGARLRGTVGGASGRDALTWLFANTDEQ